jgi:hypothetical protein
VKKKGERASQRYWATAICHDHAPKWTAPQHSTARIAELGGGLHIRHLLLSSPLLSSPSVPLSLVRLLPQMIIFLRAAEKGLFQDEVGDAKQMAPQ